jgi:hypothetical protein
MPKSTKGVPVQELENVQVGLKKSLNHPALIIIFINVNG